MSTNNVEETSAIPDFMPSASKYQLEESLWALDYPELQRACFLARACAVQAPRKCQFRNVPSILQNGPTCGLTAVSMLLEGRVTPDELLTNARERRYTNNGEIFSASYLFQLIGDSLAKECSVESKHAGNSLECQLHEGQLNCATVRRNLVDDSALLFVPYDADYNNEPCLRSGDKAHWALIIGYMITEKDEFFVIARHGKSRCLAVWSLSALSESNSNLVRFAQPKKYPDLDFMMPPGGIAGELGLRERAIIVKGHLPFETVTVR